MKKAFIITVDTEGDNLWAWEPGKEISVENVRYIERFQKLCESYNFKPVYLVNYEMAQSDELVSLLKEKAKTNLCEIGMHLHAWNSPPYYELPNKYNGCSYITEYPTAVVREKHEFLRNYIIERFDIVPVSYRSGRWATNEDLFKVLDDLGFLVDCSITPELTHEGNVGMSVPKGNNYYGEKYQVRRLGDHLIEVPMSTCRTHNIHGKNFRNRMSHLIKGESIWLRPATNSFEDMVRLTKILEKGDNSYLEFMLHSSELMPGGSPYCKDDREVEIFYDRMEKYFKYICHNYEGVTLKEFYKLQNLQGSK